MRIGEIAGYLGEIAGYLAAILVFLTFYMKTWARPNVASAVV